ncbi:MAG: DUF1844 domain-containing protein [Bdellovibrionales bacterium]|nr:DUF1844 domain-containing protein [Bdellovibrionales bacterium]
MTSAPETGNKIDLTTFFLSIASAAYMGLGLGPGEKNETNLELARQNIDLLELMQSKTKGNRSAEEDRLIDQLLFELRLRFVEKTKPTKA